jgi:hypothetical protein
VAVDGAGNLYVSDVANHTLRKIVLATGAVTTLAGQANVSGSFDATGTAATFYQPAGIATDGAGNLNGDFEPAYLGRLTPTRRRANHDAYL